MVTKISPGSVDDTVSRLTAVLDERGIKLFAVVDGGQTRLNYLEPAELANRYGLSDELAGRLAAIDTVTDAATAVAGR